MRSAGIAAASCRMTVAGRPVTTRVRTVTPSRSSEAATAARRAWTSSRAAARTSGSVASMIVGQPQATTSRSSGMAVMHSMVAPAGIVSDRTAATAVRDRSEPSMATRMRMAISLCAPIVVAGHDRRHGPDSPSQGDPWPDPADGRRWEHDSRDDPRLRPCVATAGGARPRDRCRGRVAAPGGRPGRRADDRRGRPPARGQRPERAGRRAATEPARAPCARPSANRS